MRAVIRGAKAIRKLKKSGYKNWRQYKHNRDPDVNQYCIYLDQFYKGYPYLYSISDYRHYAYHLLADHGPGGRVYGYDEMKDWLDKKIRWNYRVDIHRVWIDQSGRAELNDIGGSDIIYFAFKREQDFTHFLLRWA